MNLPCYTLRKAFKISKKQQWHQNKDCNQMIPKLHELLREVDIHLNQMVENQTDFHKASLFLVDIQRYY